ncbi:LysR family transcriptional regulator [Achromobacter xylosoxidans]
MELRHFRYFVALAEELHFARAAQRLNIEQSPLSRAIKELEEELSTQLFARNPRGTRLTLAGEVFLDNVKRVFLVVDQAKASAQAAAAGFRGSLRVAVSDGIVPARLSILLAQNRLEEPEVEIRLFEVPLSQQLKGLRDDLYDAGFSRSDDIGDGLKATPVWQDPLVVALPARHPLLAFGAVPLASVLEYPLVLCHPEACEGHYKQIDRILRAANRDYIVADHVASHEVMLALVAAGYGIGLACEAQFAYTRETEIAIRPLAGNTPMLTTYLLHPDDAPFSQLESFTTRAMNAGARAHHLPPLHAQSRLDARYRFTWPS